ncbi:prolyl oligopeptidase family serine peptidase [Streptomyces sp. NPDC021212]|uniref:S9 family peptidase n=1 Tax=Streptomyces sp. NPDC021212 TaxID=3365118 RepID=UPI00379164DA
MRQTTATAPYGTWPSPIGANLAASHDGHPEYVGTVGPEVWWTAPRPTEGGRRALIRRRADGTEEPVLPPPWNARSQVMGYGGTPWAAAPRPSGGPLVVFVHFADQRLYAYEPDAPAATPPRPLTPVSEVGEGLRWADLRLPPDRGEVWCVLEEFTGERPTDVRRVIAAVPLDGSAAEDRTRVRELTDARHDFVTGPRLSPDGRRVAWIAWDHPRMPWDGTVVMVADVPDVPADGPFREARAVLGGPEESIPQIDWAPDGALLATTDRTGWWNLHRLPPRVPAAAGPHVGAGAAPGPGSDAAPGAGAGRGPTAGSVAAAGLGPGAVPGPGADAGRGDAAGPGVDAGCGPTAGSVAGLGADAASEGGEARVAAAGPGVGAGPESAAESRRAAGWGPTAGSTAAAGSWAEAGLGADVGSEPETAPGPSAARAAAGPGADVASEPAAGPGAGGVPEPAAGSGPSAGGVAAAGHGPPAERGAAAGAGQGAGARGVCPRQEEFGGPLWKLGHRWFAPLDGGLIAVLHGRGAQTLGILDPETGELADVAGPWTEWEPTLAVDGDRVVGVAASPRSGHEVVELDTRTGRARVIGSAHTDPVDPAYYPEPQVRTFTGADGREIHAHLYPPHNPGHTAPPGELPPYVVWAHGGPTGRAPLVLDLEIAYFTSRGIGVAEVNYGGSTGYGRAYRDRLRERWGVADVEDCAAVAGALADEGVADRARLAIRGGSAGGWTAAVSLTAIRLYACGTVIYPILDPAAWATGETHDFESRYAESLIGPVAEVPDRYRERSPLHRVDRITAPFLLLQGLDDTICPPAQCERFVAAMAGRGVPHAYLTFEGEGHGFRRADTMVRALEAELSLYAHAFGLSVPGVPDLELRT